MLTIANVCDLYAWLYTKLPVPDGTFDHVMPTDGAYCAVKTIDGTAYVLFRGSVTFMDWQEDFLVSIGASQFHDPKLGPLHLGFAMGVQAVRSALDVLVETAQRIIIIGHSLGAGHALIYAGYRAADQLPVERVLTFGAPRPGGAQLAKVLSATAQWSYRNGDANGHDLITDVPLGVPPLLDYQHPSPLTDVSCPPLATDRWGPFRYHHFGLYCKALGAIGPAARSLL